VGRRRPSFARSGSHIVFYVMDAIVSINVAYARYMLEAAIAADNDFLAFTIAYWARLMLPCSLDNI